MSCTKSSHEAISLFFFFSTETIADLIEGFEDELFEDFWLTDVNSCDISCVGPQPLYSISKVRIQILYQSFNFL